MLSTRAPFQAATVSRTTVRGASVVVSARPTKAADFRGLDNGEILQKVDELKKEKLRLQYMQKTRGNMLNPGEEANPEAVQVQSHQFKDVRRQIAQLETVLREREIADGITRKQSRQLRREVKVAAGFGNL